ncbi:GroES-like protein [Epithele typhae]|uniref:GroES-like protein n=1 Tax=Epithele typhae TaxID=378194 RepID=UPI0020089338|nr:GroES-like protein [Epithele typhae]KAH9925013.1 GroES-like protein [Epithele typhae]
MSTQKALLLPAKGSSWELGQSPIPKPAADEVLVKISATALNPVDWKIRKHGYFVAEYPFVSGTDGAGVVEEVGAGVTTLAKGDKIFFQGYFTNPKATFQEYCVVPAEITAKIPDGFTSDQVASIPLGLATVVTGLWNHDPQAAGTSSVGFPAPWEDGGLTRFAGTPAFILGGSSSVGQYALQMARLAQFSPIVTTASPRNAAHLRTLGATHVLDRALAPAAALAALAQATAGAPPALVYDAISSPETQALGYAALAPGSALVVTLPDRVPAELKAADRSVVGVFGNVHAPQNRAVGVEMYRRLPGWLESGELVPNAVEVVPGGLAGIPEGLDRLEANKVSAIKLIARPQETA